MGLIYERGEARFDEDVWVAVVLAPGGGEVIDTPPCTSISFSSAIFYSTVLNIQGRVKMTVPPPGARSCPSRTCTRLAGPSSG